MSFNAALWAAIDRVASGKSSREEVMAQHHVSKEELDMLLAFHTSLQKKDTSPLQNTLEKNLVARLNKKESGGDPAMLASPRRPY